MTTAVTAEDVVSYGVGWCAEGVLADGRRTNMTTGGGVVLTAVTVEDRAAGYAVATYPGTD